MARLRSCRCCGDWHDLGKPWPHNCISHFGERPHARSDFPTPMIRIDTMDAVQSQITGKMHDSKSSLRSEYKAHGVVEMGNDAPLSPSAPAKPGGVQADIVEALDKVKQGYKPAPVESLGIAPAASGADWIDA